MNSLPKDNVNEKISANLLQKTKPKHLFATAVQDQKAFEQFKIIVNKTTPFNIKLKIAQTTINYGIPFVQKIDCEVKYVEFMLTKRKLYG